MTLTYTDPSHSFTSLTGALTLESTASTAVRIPVYFLASPDKTHRITHRQLES